MNYVIDIPILMSNPLLLHTLRSFFLKKNFGLFKVTISFLAHIWAIYYILIFYYNLKCLNFAIKLASYQQECCECITSFTLICYVRGSSKLKSVNLHSGLRAYNIHVNIRILNSSPFSLPDEVLWVPLSFNLFSFHLPIRRCSMKYFGVFG